MNDLLHADIFFFVSTIMLSAISIAFIIAIIYVLKILKEIRSLAAFLRGEAEKIAGDIENARQKVRGGAAYMSGLLTLLAGFFGKSAPKKRRK